LAISRQRKQDVVAEYSGWINRSRALIVSEYTGLTMKQVDDLRAKVREVGGEFHIVKNTLGMLALKQAGYPVAENLFVGSTAVTFAFTDAVGTAKVISEYARTSDILKIKGGYLGSDAITAEQVKALADLPPLPVIRAMLLGTILAPASKLVRTLAEPARSLAAVFQAYADRDKAEEAAPIAA
jgi:large subunit ribosomal protein L10